MTVQEDFRVFKDELHKRLESRLLSILGTPISTYIGLDTNVTYQVTT